MTDPAPDQIKTRFQPRRHADLATLRRDAEATADQRRPVALDQPGVGRLSRMDAL